MRRRALLANATTTTAAALALGTAGCLTTDRNSSATTTDDAPTDTGIGNADDDGTASGTESTTTEDDSIVGLGDTVTVEGVDLELGALSLQSSFVEHLWPSWDAEAPNEGLYAVLPVQASAEAMPLYDDPPLQAVVDGDRWRDGGPTVAAMDDEAPVRFAIPVPTGSDVDDVTIAIEDAGRTRHFPLRDHLLSTLQDPPSFAVTPNVPDTAPADDPVTFSVTVENTGASRGTLALAVTHDNIYDNYWTRTISVDPGTERTASFEPSVAVPGDDGIEISLDWGLDRMVKTVTATNDGTTTSNGG